MAVDDRHPFMDSDNIRVVRETGTANGNRTGAMDVLLVDAAGAPASLGGSLPAGAATEAKQDAGNTLLGAVTETAPATDTASSGLNGRLQRIAQRITSVITLLAGGLPAALSAGGGVKVGIVDTPKSASANTPEIQTDADALAANASRKSWSVQNVGTNPLFVRLGAGASDTLFHFVLKGGTADKDGLGAAFFDEVYTGAVSVAGTSPKYVVTEL